MTNIIRWPMVLDEHEAQFAEDDDGVGNANAELAAGLAQLDRIAVPAAEPAEPVPPRQYVRAGVGLLLGGIAIMSIGALAHFAL